MSECAEAENRLATVALGKTVAFLLYSVLGAVTIGFPIAFLVPALVPLSASLISIIILSCLVGVETLVLVAVVRGWLPGTQSRVTQSFSEKQLAYALGLISLGTWVLVGAGLEGSIIRWVLNGPIFIGVVVYFVLKSLVSRRPRWGVLSSLVLPTIELLYQVNSRGA